MYWLQASLLVVVGGDLELELGVVVVVVLTVVDDVVTTGVVVD